MNRALLRPLLFIQAVLALACFAAEGFCWAILGLRFPYDCPIFVFKGDFFPDFTLLIDRIFVHFHTLAFFAPGDHHFMYPPAATLLYEPFALVPHLRVFTFAACLVLTVCIMAALFARALILRGAPPKQTILAISAGVLLSYPAWFEIQRGNVEMFIWAITAAGVWAFYRGKGYSAAACFGAVGAMKLYPAVFFGLLFARRQYRQIAFGLLVAVALSTVCLWLEYPNVTLSLRETLRGLQEFQFTYVQGRYLDVLSYDHSLFSLLKRVLSLNAAHTPLASRLYFRVFAFGGLVLYFLRIRKLPLANQVVTLTVATILFPPVSFDYTLLHLYTPLCLTLILFWKADPPPTVRWTIVLFALLLSPLTEFIHAGHTLEGQIKSVLLLALFIVGLIYPISPDESHTETARSLPASPEVLA